MNRIIRYIICFLIGVIFFILLHNIETIPFRGTKQELEYTGLINAQGDASFEYFDFDIDVQHSTPLDRNQQYLWPQDMFGQKYRLSLYFVNYEYKYDRLYRNWLKNKPGYSPIMRGIGRTFSGTNDNLDAYKPENLSWPRIYLLAINGTGIWNTMTSVWNRFVWRIFSDEINLFLENIGGGLSIIETMLNDAFKGTSTDHVDASFSELYIAQLYNQGRELNIARDRHQIFRDFSDRLLEIRSDGQQESPIQYDWLNDSDMIKLIKNAITYNYARGKSQLRNLLPTHIYYALDTDLYGLMCYVLDIGNYVYTNPTEERIEISIGKSRYKHAISTVYRPNESHTGDGSAEFAFKLQPLYEFIDINNNHKRLRSTSRIPPPKYKIQYTDNQSIIRIYSLILFKYLKAKTLHEQQRQIDPSIGEFDFPYPILLSNQHGFKWPEEIVELMNYQTPPSSSALDASDVGYVKVHKVDTERGDNMGSAMGMFYNRTGIKKAKADGDWDINGGNVPHVEGVEELATTQIATDTWRKETQHDYYSIIGLIQTGINANKFEDPQYPFGLDIYTATEAWENMEIVYEYDHGGGNKKIYSYGYYPCTGNYADVDRCVRYAEFYNKSIGFSWTDTVFVFNAPHGWQGVKDNDIRGPDRNYDYNINQITLGITDCKEHFDYIKKEAFKCSWWQTAGYTQVPLRLYVFSCAGAEKDSISRLNETLRMAINAKAMQGETSDIPGNVVTRLNTLLGSNIVPHHIQNQQTSPSSGTTTQGSIHQAGLDQDELAKKYFEPCIKSQVILFVLNYMYINSRIKNIEEQKKCKVNVLPYLPSVFVKSTEQRQMEGMDHDMKMAATMRQNSGIGALLSTISSGLG